MEEHLLAISGTNEPESAVADDSLDCALHRHLDAEGTICGGSINIASEVTSRTRWGPLYQHASALSKGGMSKAGVRQSPIGLKGTPHPPPCGPPSPLGEGGGFSFYPSPLGRGRWVRGLFASNAFMAPEVCDTRDFDGTLMSKGGGSDNMSYRLAPLTGLLI
jgi:hypothetical protein